MKKRPLIFIKDFANNEGKNIQINPLNKNNYENNITDAFLSLMTSSGLGPAELDKN